MIDQTFENRIVEIHPFKDELIIINRNKAIAVSKGTWKSTDRGRKFDVIIYEIDTVISYTIIMNVLVNEEYPLHSHSYRRKEMPISRDILFEHFLVA